MPPRPPFQAYFEQASPIAEIAQLNTGSRPVSRDGTLRVVDLRAIPWVFAWMQNRHLLPAWSTLVGVQALAQPGYLIEVEAVAVID